jgi:hypothetical protein
MAGKFEVWYRGEKVAEYENEVVDKGEDAILEIDLSQCEQGMVTAPWPVDEDGYPAVLELRLPTKDVSNRSGIR